jgi:hypothetical protein
MLPTLLFRRALLLLGCACLAATLPARAADEAKPSYAVLSIIGDKMTLVWLQRGVGSNIDQNGRREVPMKDAALDNMALLAADDVFRRLKPAAKVALMTSRDADVLAQQERGLDGPADAAQLLAPIKEMLQKTQATRLILISKARAEARFPLNDGLVGTGKVAGLGFYLDAQKRIQLVDSGASDTGFIGPHAYFWLSVIDPQSMTVLRRKQVTESMLVATAESKDALGPWEAMTPKQKLDAMERLIRKGIDRALPDLLSGE